jgi:predicted transcriptional regulator YheO
MLCINHYNSKRILRDLLVMDFTQELSRKGALQRAEWVVTIVDVWFTWVVRSLLAKGCHAMGETRGA